MRSGSAAGGRVSDRGRGRGGRGRGGRGRGGRGRGGRGRGDPRASQFYELRQTRDRMEVERLVQQLQPQNVKEFSMAISAFGRARDWRRALALLDEMRAAGVAPNVISFNAAIQACAAADQPAAALSLFDEGFESCGPDLVMFNAVLDAVCRRQPGKARDLWLRGVGLRLYPECEKQEVGVPTLDLHDLSEGAAETALRWWLEARVLEVSPPPERLIVITGWGKTRVATSTGDVRGRVASVLAELGAPTLPTDNPGTLVVDARTWHAVSMR